jgi:class 3 adenylate cyclase/tetratricopeptide (TPR) repeat protein
MTDPSSTPQPSSTPDSGFHEFSQSGSHTDDPQETGSFPASSSEPGPAPTHGSLPAAFGRYRVIGLLGKGSFGTVYAAEDTELKRTVAVKVPHRLMPGKAADYFLQEARRLAQLKHPGIVTVYDVGFEPAFEGGRHYIVSDFVTGVSLKEWLRNHRPTWEQTVAIVAAVADALGHAHAHGVIHRDVKPSNIVLTEGLRPILLDFGLALSESEATGKSATAVGTPAYMSPEQARGEGHRIDGRTDVFSLGSVLYEMLCGRRPFTAADAHEMMRQVREDDPRPPRQLDPSIPRELERICLRAMANRLADRYTTAGDLAAELRAAVGAATPTHAPPAHAGPAVEQSSERTLSQSVCTRCDTPCQPGAVYCAGCGAPLAQPDQAAISSKGESVGTASNREAERRQVTILYVNNNLGESVELLEALDPEEQHALLERCREAYHEMAARFHGAVLTSAGPGALICFGFPVAFEDAPRRAVYTGLAILRAMTRIAEEVHQRRGLQFTTCAAIHTGPAICGESGGGSSAGASGGAALSVVGEARNVATRLEPYTEPGVLVISEATHKMVEGFFVEQSLGRHAVKGLTQPTELYRVTGASEARSRLDVVGASGLTPLIGREQEVGLLQDRWERVREGQGQAVLLAGEAGIGKSRLVHVIKERVREEHTGEGRPIVEWRGSPYYQNSGLFPATEYFERHFRFRPEDTPRERLDKLSAALRTLGMDRPEVVPIFAGLLSIPLDDRYTLPALSPQRLRERTLEVLLDWIHACAQKQPTLFIVEDLHWIDASTLELLRQLVEQADSEALLVLMTTRPEFTPPWAGRTQLTQVVLHRLTKGQIGEMIRRKTGLDKVPSGLVEQIALRTDGVPLFVEEFTKMLIEAGAVHWTDAEASSSGTFDMHAVPATLHDLLLARLDRMGSVRDVVQVASAIGREFTYELLHAVCPLDETELRRELTKLIQAEILFAKGRPPQSSYLFKHALIQDAAYQSLLKTRRREFHRTIAQVLEKQFPVKAEREPELFARHCTEAGLTREALVWWEKAGYQALERSAVAEAIGHVTTGLRLVPEQEESPERDLQEVRLQLLLSVGLMATEGYGSSRLPAIHARVRELCVKRGAREQLFQVLWGVWAWSFIRDELQLGKELAQEMAQLADTLNEPGYRMEAHYVAACNSFYRGEFTETRERAEAGLALHTPELAHQHARYTGQNSGVTIRCYRAFSLWYLGHADQSRQCMRETLVLAADLKHPFTHVFALYHDAFLKQQLRMGPETLEAGQVLYQAAVEQSFAFWAALGTLTRGIGLLLTGVPAEAIDALRKGLVALRATGAEIVVPHYSSRLAEAFIATRQYDDAARTLDEAVAMAEKAGELFSEAECHRLRGDLLLARSDDRPGAEACYRRAVETAQRQKARALELRAAASLARLVAAQGRDAEARQMLAPIAAWFGEGADTADLIAARALLNTVKEA